MKISVALCTYNGAAFLELQLASIASQTRPPDEIVICDDGSTDATLTIAESFRAKAAVPVRIFANPENLGSTKNFERAISLCDGEIVALCDQDDVWLPQKLSRLEAEFRARPDAAFVFSDALVVDLHRQALGYRLWEAVGFTRRQQRMFQSGSGVSVLLRYNVVTGATLAFRASFRDLLLPIPSSWVQDGWIGLLLSCVAVGTPIASPLIEYRQHPGQQLGGKKTTLREKINVARQQGTATFLGTALDYFLALDRLQQSRDRVRDPAILDALEDKIRHFHAKARMRQSRRLPRVMHEMLTRHYGRYSRGWKSLAQDLFL